MNTPKKIGPYQIIKRIAEGGMAEVYLGKTESRFGVSKLAAVKTSLQDGDREKLKEMFFNEIRISANLSHQNIVKIYDFGEFENRGYMAMEYINGVTLRELMSYLQERNEKLSSSFVLYIIHQVSLALAYAYQSVDPQTGRQLKLIHRDISPHNILLSFEGEVKVIDFGIAKKQKDNALETAGQIKGKVAYMSPEQVQGQELDSGSDIFSLGVVYWELITNERFFPGTTTNDVKQSILAYAVSGLEKAKFQNRADELWDVLPIMLHQEPEKRASDANELARLLGTLLSALHPDFSALAFADYLKDIFSTTYNSNLEHIRQFVDYADRTVATEVDAEGFSEDVGELDEFDTKILEGSFSTGVILEKLASQLVPPKPPELPAQSILTKMLSASPVPPRPVLKVDLLAGSVPTIPFYRHPKRPPPKSGNFGFFTLCSIAVTAILFSGLTVGKSAIPLKNTEPVTAVVAATTPTAFQKVSAPVVVEVKPATPVVMKKAPVLGKGKRSTKARMVAKAPKPAKRAPAGRTSQVKAKAFDMGNIRNGMAYPSGTKCVNCWTNVGE
ncbi:serine/threonine-protein kinase [Bdellovibrio sp. GT3]|uniref:serine/threonine-protein kinase n=1 Tax=Bdellovibrio sp. GT3 TaxID=3136282 RepID=UPI0030F45FDB